MIKNSLIPSRAVELDWPEWAAELCPKVLQIRIGLFQKFAKWVKTNAGPVWNGIPGHAMSDEDQKGLYERMGKEVVQDAREDVLCARWLSHLISVGNSLGHWRIALLPPVVRLPPIAPMVTRRDFWLLESYRDLEAWFWNSMHHEPKGQPLSWLLMCSAMVCGGVSGDDMLTAIGQIDGTEVKEFKGVLRVELRIAGNNSVRRQRWYPDAQTAVLLVRCLRAGLLPMWSAAQNGIKSTSQDICKELSKLGAPISPAAPIGDLLRATYVSHFLQLPPFCTEYLSGNFRTESLPDATVTRLCGWRAAEGMQDESAVHGEVTRASSDFLHTDHVYDPTSDPRAQLKFIRGILKILSQKSDHLKEVRKELDGKKSSLWSITYFLGQWACWRLGERLLEDDPKSALKAIKGSSINTYLSTFARYLISVAETENLLEMEVDDWESLFELAADRVKKTAQRAVFWRCVKSFSTYMSFYGAPEIALQELDGYVSSVDVAVSVNLVGEKEFQVFKKAMLDGVEPSSDQDKQYLDRPQIQVLFAGILGFRCGLRRREVQMLWAHDIFPGPQAILLVRASTLAKLKSRSAHRRIPLHALLPADELKLLLDYLEHRRKQLGKLKVLLLSRPDSPQVPLPDQFIFKPITEAFQRIQGSGGHAFRFHHLRHSFANWLLLALMAADNPALLDPADPLVASGPLDLKRVFEIKNALFPRMLGTEPEPTRKNLFLVSALLGHLSPETTLQHYIHLMDWLAGRELDIALSESLRECTADDLRNACGLSASMPYKSPYSQLRAKPVAFLRQFVQQNCPSELREIQVEPNPSVDLTDIVQGIGNVQPPGPSRMMLMLGHMFHLAPEKGWKRGEAAANEDVLSKLERDHGVSRAVLQNLFTNYLGLFAKQSEQIAKSSIEPPGPPRTDEDAREFWRILDATSEAFGSTVKRGNMLAAAGFLVRRNGPKTGNVYFGHRRELALAAVDGLVAMGMEVDILTLEIRVTDLKADLTLEFKEIMKQVGRRGVAIKTVPIEKKKKKEKVELEAEPDQVRKSKDSATMRLRVAERKSLNSDADLKRKVGRLRGLNYATLWVLFANALASKGEPSV